MAIVEIACQCGHHGFVAARVLPGVLRRCTCDHAEFFRKGRHTVRSRHTAAIDDEMWAAYDAPAATSVAADFYLPAVSDKLRSWAPRAARPCLRLAP